MANHETENNFRTSVQQTSSVDQLGQALAGLGQKIIAAGQEAKITENFSAAQLDLHKLNQQYQIDNEANPFAGLDGLKEKRDEILSSYGEQISPFFRKQWQDSARGLATKDDMATETWAYAQTKKNTVTSINTSIKNNLSQAALDGENFGNSDTDEIGSMLNYAQSKKQLAGFGDKHLGAETTTALLQDYDGDYLKTFISGVADSNPLKALRIMERDDVKSSFTRKDQYLSMKKAVETRALQVDKINGEKQVLGVLKDENALLTKSLTDNVSYADLQSEFSRLSAAGTPMSAEAQSFFMKANGYESRAGKLTQSEQLQQKAQLYSDMTELLKQDKMTSQDVAGFQKKIYAGMDNGSLNEQEGANFLNQIVAPLVGQKEEQFGTFSQDHWFSPDVGFGGVQEVFDKELAVPLPDTGVTTDKTEQGTIDSVNATNNANKVKLYDYYMNSLQQQAETVGVPLADISKLNKTQQRKLYADAQAEALRLFHVDANPALSTLNDLPNQTLTKGKLIQGAAGKRDLKPDFTTKGNFVILEKDGHRARRYDNGDIEVLN